MEQNIRGDIMIKIYNSDINTNELKTLKEIENGSWINMVNPTDEEINKVCQAVKIKEDFIRYSLDYEEKARIDEEDEDGTILFVVDVPIIDGEIQLGEFGCVYFGDWDQVRARERKVIVQITGVE